MAIGYIVEVKIGDEVRYMGPGGVIGTIPKFFNSHARVKYLLRNLNHGGYGNSRFNLKSHKDSTTIIQIKNLQLGLKGSFATLMSVEDFLSRDFNQNGVKIPNNKNAIYRIQLATPLDLAAKADPVYVMPKRGQRNEKFGRTWNRGGDVRSHITMNIKKLKQEYRDALVIEVEMQPDGFTPRKVKLYPIIDFYCASPSARAQYDSTFPNAKYTPTNPEYA